MIDKLWVGGFGGLASTSISEKSKITDIFGNEEVDPGTATSSWKGEFFGTGGVPVSVALPTFGKRVALTETKAETTTAFTVDEVGDAALNAAFAEQWTGYV